MDISFKDYVFLTEAFSDQIEDLKQDSGLKMMLGLGYPHLKDVDVVHAGNMDDHGLRVLSFKNPSGRYELHLHNNYVLPGHKPDDVNHRAMLTSLKVMYNLAKKHLESGHDVQIQVGPDGSNYNKYSSLAKRLVAETGYNVSDIPDQPLASMPSIKTKAFVIQHVQTR